MRVVAAPDKFRGTARAPELARAIGEAAWEAGWDVDEVPLSDGGEGLLDVFGGANRFNEVHGPDRRPVTVGWRLSGELAVVESAAASGLDLVGGAEGNDPVHADTGGTGELVRIAAEAGARRIIVGLGGSATTDGGLGAVQAVGEPKRLAAVELIVACDVDIPFLDAAARFAPQKGASEAEVRLLERRLARTAELYRDADDVDVTRLAYAGAAGGLAGGLAALGATLVSGFEVVADEVCLDEVVDGADLVVTGEGFVDAGSYQGKVVGGVVAMAAAAGVPVLVVAGDVFDGTETRAPTCSLVQTFGEERARSQVLGCVREVVAAELERRSAPRRERA